MDMQVDILDTVDTLRMVDTVDMVHIQHSTDSEDTVVMVKSTNWNNPLITGILQLVFSLKGFRSGDQGEIGAKSGETRRKRSEESSANKESGDVQGRNLPGGSETDARFLGGVFGKSSINEQIYCYPRILFKW